MNAPNTSLAASIASSTPGRLRLRHVALLQPQRLERLRTQLQAWPEVRSAEANARTGSLLLHYDALALAPEACAERCLAALLALLPPAPAQPPGAGAGADDTAQAPAAVSAVPAAHPASAPAPQSARTGAPAAPQPSATARHAGPVGSRRVRANRWAKRIMLASLGGSLALAAAGVKSAHVALGLLFLHALGLHLWLHRRRLLS